MDNLDMWYSSIRTNYFKEFLSNPDNKVSNKEKAFLRCMDKMLKQNNNPSPGQVKWAYDITAKNNYSTEDYRKPGKVIHIERNVFSYKHLTIRLAWHDNYWNGRICKDPENNDYCVGEHSLLSRRIRENRKTEFEQNHRLQVCDKSESQQKSDSHCSTTTQVVKSLKDMDNQDANKGNEAYQPPCYWSINAFAEDSKEYDHENVAAPNFGLIRETIPPYSVISWPFKLSFTRETGEAKKYGKYYPHDLFEKKINSFNKQFKPESSIVFLYTNYSNPISGEEQKYCVVGCGLLQEIGDPQHFHPKPGVLEKERAKKDKQNFPTLSWTRRYKLDFPDNGVMLPYHDYLNYAKDHDLDDITLAEYLDDVKVLIDEQELVQGFKYVAMDIDDDQAIYVLLKMAKAFRNAMKHEHAIIDISKIEESLETLDRLISMTYERRWYFPGFVSLCSVVQKANFREKSVKGILEKIKVSANPIVTMLSLFTADSVDVNYLNYVATIRDIKSKISEARISPLQFLQLSMINLTVGQFERICKEIGLPEAAENPFSIYEASVRTVFESDQKPMIDLFKIDLAFYPNEYYFPSDPVIHTFTQDDRRRIRALIIQYLHSLSGQGDCYAEANVIISKIEDSPLFYNKNESKLRLNYDLAAPEGIVKSHFVEELEIVESDNKVFYYLKSLYLAEKSINRLVTSQLMKKMVVPPDTNWEEDILGSAEMLSTKLQNFDKAGYTEERHKLFGSVFSSGIYVISGFPGSGKSYDVLRIVKHLEKMGESVLVLTPTGKASLRLRQNEIDYNIDKSCMTIDKFLIHRSTTQYDTIVIDEMSMVDIVKFDKLVNAVCLECLKRIILVGDRNQLPPIGFGKPFIDIIDHLESAKPISHYIELRTNCRITHDTQIFDFAQVFSLQNNMCESIIHEIESGDKYKRISDHFQVYYWSNKAELRQAISDAIMHKFANEENVSSKQMLMDEILMPGQSIEEGLKQLDKFQILTPYRTEYFGASSLNAYIQKEFRCQNKFFRHSEWTIKQFDKVIQTQNIYNNRNLVLSNGSIGLSDKWDLYFAELQGSGSANDAKIINKLRADSIEPAYAITVHKAQGSGFDHTFVVLPNKKALLSRELVYTALTRSRESITLFLYKNKADNMSIISSVLDRSDTEKRMTSVFKDPEIRQLYQTRDGTIVKSKNELIIYDALYNYQQANNGFDFEYEPSVYVSELKCDFHPDFVVRTNNGDIFWEHLGMLDNSYYYRNWKERLSYYRRMGLSEKLITTDDLNKINSKYLTELISHLSKGEFPPNHTMTYSERHYTLNQTE